MSGKPVDSLRSVKVTIAIMIAIVVLSLLVVWLSPPGEVKDVLATIHVIGAVAVAILGAYLMRQKGGR